MPTEKDSRPSAKPSGKTEVPLTDAEKHVIKRGDEEYRRLKAERKAAKKASKDDS